MYDTIAVTGVVATPVKHTISAEGLEVSNFRLASNHRRFDRASGNWVESETNWYTVASFRQLALNVHASLDKGQQVVVVGRLKVREWSDGERTGRDVEIIADAVGHDLARGTTSFTRTPRPAPEAAGPARDEPHGAETPEPAGFPADAQSAVGLPF
ncbi:single-stranded DNA-binding protein [Protaetiibacter larvae]|nr:single-stranded DNA-binding protein [Protaetiibacter larvae]